MGFKSVYRMLMDVFPQVDNRILRAVAIENSKDADKAAGVVLMEIIPNIACTLGSANDSLDNIASSEENTVHLGSKNLDENAGLFKISSPDDGNCNGDQVCGPSGKQAVSPVKLSNVSGRIPSANGVSNILNFEDVPFNQCGVESNLERLWSNVSSLDLNAFPVNSSNISGCIPSTHGVSTILNCEDLSSNLECLVESNLEQLCSNVNSLDINASAVKLSSPAVLDCLSHVSENGLQQANDNVPEESYISDSSPVNYITVTKVVNSEHEPVEGKSTHELVDFDISDSSPVNYITVTVVDSEHEPMEGKSTQEQVDFENEGVEDLSTHEVIEVEDEHAFDSVVSRSGNICRTDLLEDIIKEARDNKKTLFSAMESLISLMREVEVREKEAERVKVEAAKGPLDILTSVEDLKEMLGHAREANDMHSGEVYGEKAILATEAKELQSRLLCLSDERDNSLAILDEMRRSLEQRLDAAEEEMKAAEQEKMEKEESARKALDEQQLLMDKLVKESKILKQEAKENSKLQEFLMDRGRVVDMLQGEISVICHDVKLLKQKFDEGVPLSESLSSSQTSCKLASSSSSLKSLALDPVLVQNETALETPKRTSPSSSISDLLSSGEEIEVNVCDAQVDADGWEFCDKELNI